MRAIVFLGPTMGVAEAAALLDADYRPPAAQGDVYRAALGRPQAIGIVDGYFDTLPSIWHKEVLWAMSQGIHVFGAASMGAIRAAELAAFGMEGVGRIFAAYAAGELDDDDEVAVAHGPAADGYPLMSEALVNVRATLEAAVAAGVIGAASAAAIVAAGRDCYYPERSYPRLLAAARGAAPEHELAALRDWLPAGRRDQKRDDAAAMLRLMAERLGAGLPPKRVRYHLEQTVFLEQLRRRAPEAAGDGADDGDLTRAAILDELRLRPGLYRQTRAAGLAMGLALALAERHGDALTPERAREVAEGLRRARGLERADDLWAWMAEQGLDDEGFFRIVRAQAELEWAGRQGVADLDGHILDALRLDGSYALLAARARAKGRALAAHGAASLSLADLGATREGLLGWFFEERAGIAMPRDLARYAAESGFRDEQSLVQAILREYCYTRLDDATADEGGPDERR